MLLLDFFSTLFNFVEGANSTRCIRITWRTLLFNMTSFSLGLSWLWRNSSLINKRLVEAGSNVPCKSINLQSKSGCSFIMTRPKPHNVACDGFVSKENACSSLATTAPPDVINVSCGNVDSLNTSKPLIKSIVLTQRFSCNAKSP